jgi:hypothetical protein
MIPAAFGLDKVEAQAHRPLQSLEGQALISLRLPIYKPGSCSGPGHARLGSLSFDRAAGSLRPQRRPSPNRCQHVAAERQRDAGAGESG